MESRPKTPVTPEEESKHAPGQSRRSFLKGLGMAAVAGVTGAGASIVERKVETTLNERNSPGVALDPLQQTAFERVQRFYEVLKIGEPESTALATEFIGYYDTELKALLSTYSELNNRLTSSKWGSASRDILENEILANAQRQEWVRGQIKTLKDPIDFYMQNKSVPQEEPKGNPKKHTVYM
jgi:hypothetical protein